TAEFAQNRTPDKLAPQQNPIKSKGLHLLRQSCFENYTSPVLKTTRQTEFCPVGGGNSQTSRAYF
ncbi:MAG: hypothetical protein J6Z49_09230, partial [Kiritimatiellae bacterium]|nr:hypothetical protein [Kiritimatiellia bacterium]